MAEARSELVSTIRLVPDFLSSARADALLDALMLHVPWQREEITLFGQTRAVPRLVAWYGDPGLCYRYSNRDHLASGWLTVLAGIRDQLAAELPCKPNFVLLNRYRTGNDSMGWHTDNEPMAADLLGSVSLGAQRRFLLRASTGAPSTRLDLTHGSLVVFDRHLPHCLPKTRRECGERINLSFRSVPIPIEERA